MQYTHLEPVNSAAGEQGWEPPESGPEGVPTVAHGDNHMQLLSHPLHKQLPEGAGAAVSLANTTRLAKE